MCKIVPIYTAIKDNFKDSAGLGLWFPLWLSFCAD